MAGAVNRRVTFKLYPSRAQLVALERLHDLHRMLYNAALQERIEAWRRKDPLTGIGTSISFADQCKSLTTIRQPLQRMGALAASSLLKKLAHEKLPDTIKVDPELIVRESTAPVTRRSS